MAAVLQGLAELRGEVAAVKATTAFTFTTSAEPTSKSLSIDSGL